MLKVFYYIFNSYNILGLKECRISKPCTKKSASQSLQSNDLSSWLSLLQSFVPLQVTTYTILTSKRDVLPGVYNEVGTNDSRIRKASREKIKQMQTIQQKCPFRTMAVACFLLKFSVSGLTQIVVILKMCGSWGNFLFYVTDFCIYVPA